jgi:hypothetical protein
VIEDILSRLQKVRKTGANNWLACCPAHEDTSPSMTIHAADDGRILVKCFAECSFEEIVGAVGLGWEPWFPPKPKSDFVPAVRRPFPAGDVLEALWFETLVAVVSAGDLAAGKELSEREKARLWVAFDRINSGRDLVHGGR